MLLTCSKKLYEEGCFYVSSLERDTLMHLLKLFLSMRKNGNRFLGKSINPKINNSVAWSINFNQKFQISQKAYNQQEGKIHGDG